MLTKRDLKLIGQVVDERLEIKLEEKLEMKLEEKLEAKLDEKLEIKLSPMRKDIKNIRKKVNYIDRTLRIAIKQLDEADVRLDRRVSRIEQHLNFS